MPTNVLQILTQNLEIVLKVQFVLPTGPLTKKEDWRCVSMECGEPFVVMVGTRQMPMCSANNWAWEMEVKPTDINSTSSMAAYGC